MPTQGTDRQTFRISEEDWAEFGDATGRAVPPSDRSSVLREFIAWYVHRRGAKLPKRPG